MKKILLVALVAMLGMQPADAQRKGGNTRTPEQMVEKLDEKLNLTDEQKTAFEQMKKERPQRKR